MPNSKIKVIFIGTSDFAVPILHALINDQQFEVVAIITQPDKKAGRRQMITAPPVKIEAEKHQIPVWQPEKISHFPACADKQWPITSIDAIVVAAYAQLIPKKILDLPQYGCINIHGSLLPKYRGAACVQAAILHGDKQAGVTIIKMNEGLDTGPILSQKSIIIKPHDTAGTLYDKLSILGAKLLIPTLKQYVAGKIKTRPQNNNQVSYVKKLKKQDGFINWAESSKTIEQFIRAMTPWPGAFTYIQTRPSKQKAGNTLMIKILKVQHEPLKNNQHQAGTLFLYNKKLAIQCGQNALIIEKIQPAGKKKMTAEEFRRGYGKFIF